MADAPVGAAENNYEQPANLKIKTVGVEISIQIHRKDTSGQAEQWKTKCHALAYAWEAAENCCAIAFLL